MVRKKNIERFTFRASLLYEVRRFKVRIAVILLAIMLPLCLYTLFMNHNEPTEIGLARNILTGTMWKQKGGWYITSPWVWVSRIDIRPMRVAITTGGHGYNSKLVQFKEEHWELFVKTEGWRYWWWSNRISFNLGYQEEYRGMRDILRGYAYADNKYPFIEITSEYQK
jgi:hypothetical protein